jgi:hypothetical protein
LQRAKYSRGFGVQSPWAYRFIRYVVNEHYPYYSYKDLEQVYGHLPKQTLKLCRLYFRIANFQRPSQVLDYNSPSDAYADYMKAGCHRMEIVPLHQPSDISKVELLRLSLEGDYRAVFEKAVQVADAQSLVVVEQIKRNRETKEFWKSIVSDPRCITTFDLYYCGIIFFDKKRYKENYKVNF